jgi:chorismate dehydratase
MVSTSLEGVAAEQRGSRTAVRLAAVSYLNAAPLVHGLSDDARFEVEREVPSRVAERLHAGEADLGMIPSIEYARGDYAIVPEIAITSRGPVRSVLLFLRGRIEDVRTVAVDSGSRTSVALTRLVLRERLRRDPAHVVVTPDIPHMLEQADAALVIGDAALDYTGGAERLDLGQAWQDLTGLPFVWAFWAGRPGALRPEHVARLQRAQRDGLAALPTIARDAARGDAARAARNEGYLRDNIAYAFGDAERAGLREFYLRAHAASLIARVPEVRLHADR